MMKPYISKNIKEYPKNYMVRRCPHLLIPYHIREFRVEPRLLNTNICKIYVTPAAAPNVGFGSNTKIIFINDFEKLMNGTDLSLCNVIKTIQPFKVLEYLEQGILNDKINKMLEKIVKKEVA